MEDQAKLYIKELEGIKGTLDAISKDHTGDFDTDMVVVKKYLSVLNKVDQLDGEERERLFFDVERDIKAYKLGIGYFQQKDQVGPYIMESSSFPNGYVI